MIRNQHRPGDWLIIDDYTGETIYRSEAVKTWDGFWTHKRHHRYTGRNPQEFVKAFADPRGISPIRPADLTAVPVSAMPTFIGKTTIRTRRDGPAVHLFPGGIGSWVIGTDSEVQ